MKIALAQQNYHIGNFKSNVQKIIEAVSKAKAAGADLVVFSELAICGYPPKDLLLFQHFIQSCEDNLQAIAKTCIGIAAIVGGPCRNTTMTGKPLYNAAYFMADGLIKSIHHKALLPTYDVFDEARYFEPGSTFNCIEYKGKRIALTICEDLWDSHTQRYTNSPMEVLAKQHPDLMINIAASPFSCSHAAERKEVLLKNAKTYQCPLLYVNQVGAHTDLIFDGGSMLVMPGENNVDVLKVLEEDFKVFDLQNINPTVESAVHENEILFKALVLGIKDYLQKTGFKKAILGLSGGIDSALVMVLAAQALGPENVHAVLMPSQYSSDHSVKDAQDLAKNLGVSYTLLPIEEIYKSFENALQPSFKNLPFNLAEENLQARSRGVLLMALSNKFNYVLLNTSNKSELAVGYGTLYGDMCGGLSVLGDVYKTKVFALANFVNKDKEIIPANTLNKPPSAELRPNQKDADSLPEYDLLDAVLFQYIDLNKGAAEIKALGYDSFLVDKILKMVNTNEYKRHQSPPILRVSEKCFGSGRRFPIVGSY
jgi:NAD+ synthase (glutamine-hydrolysing)